MNARPALTGIPCSARWTRDAEICFICRDNLTMRAIIENCTGVILAGGKNTRMPLRKAFIEVNTQEQWRHVLDSFYAEPVHG